MGLDIDSKKWTGPCGQVKPMFSFSQAKDANGGYKYRSRCDQCVAEDARRYRRKSRVSYLDAQFRSNYGIELIDYENLLAKQNGVCMICKQPPVKGRMLSVDHCHTTSKIRGLLCHTCNGGLGMFRDSKQLIAAALEYLNANT